MPILEADTIEFISRNSDQTHRLGARLGAMLEGGDLITLEGDLGSGKTVFAQGIGEGWGSTSSLISPTFVLIRQHERRADRMKLYHVDLYRLHSEAEAFGFGLEDLVGIPEAVCIVEWADRAPALFPAERLVVGLRWLDDYRRSLTFRALGARHSALLERFRKVLVGH